MSGTLSDAEKARIEQIIRWHAGAAGAKPDDAYLLVGIQNVVNLVERILDERVGEAQLVAKGWADEAAGLHRELTAMARTLLPIRNHAQAQAIACHARGLEQERDWLDLLALIERTGLLGGAA